MTDMELIGLLAVVGYAVLVAIFLAAMWKVYVFGPP